MIVRDLLVRVGYSMNSSSVSKADAAINRTKNNMQSLANTARNIKHLIAAGIAYMGVNTLGDIARLTDSWKSVEARVSLTTKSAAEQAKVCNEIYAISQRTRQEYTATADLYSRVARNSKQLGLSQAEVLAFVEDTNKALIIGGGATSENQAAILQLGQALASGRLQGDELRSILENAPRLAQAIADGLGVSLGKLREMGKTGELTATTIVKAVRNQSRKIAEEFLKMPHTASQGITVMKNSIGRLFNTIESKTKIFARIALLFEDIATKIDKCSKNSRDFLNILKVIVIYLGTIYLLTKRTAAINLFRVFAAFGKALASGKLIRFLTLFKGGAILLAGKLLLVAAIITFIILLIQDFYGWINGKDSFIGRRLGEFKDFKVKVIKWLDEIKRKAKETWADFWKKPDWMNPKTANKYDVTADNPLQDANQLGGNMGEMFNQDLRNPNAESANNPLLDANNLGGNMGEMFNQDFNAAKASAYQTFKEIADYIAECFDSGMAKASEFATSIGNYFTEVFNSAIQKITGFLNGLVQGFNTFVATFSKLITDLQTAWDNFCSDFGSAIDTYILGPLQTAIGYVNDLIDTVRNSSVGQAIGGIGDTVSRFLRPTSYVGTNGGGGSTYGIRQISNVYVSGVKGDPVVISNAVSKGNQRNFENMSRDLDYSNIPFA